MIKTDSTGLLANLGRFALGAVMFFIWFPLVVVMGGLQRKTYKRK